jgi:integrase
MQKRRDSNYAAKDDATHNRSQRKRGERKPLSALEVKSEKRRGLHRCGDGLYLQVSQWGTKSWVVRYMMAGRARKMGLGPVNVVSLADARDKARVAKRQLLEGDDPIDARLSARMERRAEAAKIATFKDCAEDYIKAHEMTWRNAKHRAQWKSTLKTYAYPIIGDLNVSAIDTPHVLKIIQPIWYTKTETAKRIRGRIEVILDYAKVGGHRGGENPARWAGHIEHNLPDPTAVYEVRHHPALPYAELPPFMRDLRLRAGVSARALEFTVLNALRTDATIKAQWTQIDFAAKTWTVPRLNMKPKRGQPVATNPHVVPLSDRAIEILESLPREEHNPFVFIGGKRGMAITNMAMAEMLKGMGYPGHRATVHGFRSCFKDWASEKTEYPEIVVEMALGHIISDKVQKAYRRGNLMEKRTALMTDWSTHCQNILLGR